jgi:hypothetical protein
MAAGGFTFAIVRPTARLVTSWSDANAADRLESIGLDLSRETLTQGGLDRAED